MSLFEIDIFGFTLAPSYYGLMYAISFGLGYWIIKKRNCFSQDQLDSIFLYVVLGVVLGGRIGYMLFYNFQGLLDSPVSLFYIWNGGMSFHGGVLGVVLAMFLFSFKHNFSFYKLADQITLIIPIGLFFGRIGNYINKELLGYAGYNGPFSVSVNNVGYFPSPLLEALLEGIVLFAILNWLYKYKKLSDGQIASLFLIIYGVFRIFVEVFFRQPDMHIGLIGGFISLGTILSIPMIVIGIVCYIFLKVKNAK